MKFKSTITFPLKIIQLLIVVTMLFGILILCLWPICHFLFEKYRIPLSDIGAALGGIAAILGLYTGIQKYFDSKEKQQSNSNLGKVINLLLRLRNFVEALRGL